MVGIIDNEEIEDSKEPFNRKLGRKRGAQLAQALFLEVLEKAKETGLQAAPVQPSEHNPALSSSST